MENKNKILILTGLLAFLCSACQPQSTVKPNIVSTPERPLQVLKSSDGVQNIAWKIVEIAGQKAQFFHHEPMLLLNANNQMLQGNTGCNLLSGRYHINTQNSQLSFEARAGHQSCSEALAQEANLMNVLAQTQAFRLQGNRLQLLNAQQQVILQAQK